MACSKSETPKPQSTAKFDSEVEVFLNQDLGIKNNSENAVTYEWDFGDGSKQSQKEPAFKYTKAGDYIVKLTTNGNSTVTKSIKVYNTNQSVVIKNNTQNTFKIILFDRINDNTVGTERFVINSLVPGQTSNPMFTNKTNIAFGGNVNGFDFVSLTPRSYVMETGKKNIININNDTAITIGVKVPD